MDDLEMNSFRESQMPENEQTGNVEHTRPQPVLSRPPALERTSTQFSYTSSTYLSPASPTGPLLHAKTPSRSSLFYWNLPPQVSAWEEKRTQTVQRMPKGPTKFWHGWKVIVFGSCTYRCLVHEIAVALTENAGLNILLVVVPVSVQCNLACKNVTGLTVSISQWILHSVLENSHLLDFICA